MKLLKCLLVAAGCATLTFIAGCVHLDYFSGRATGFNVQVADAQNQTMLLNILRAAHRFPMHFTELTTLSGTSQVSASAELSLPFSDFHDAAAVRSGTPGTSVSQSPTFNVAVLETQEFYKGMMTPVSLDQMSNYLNQGLPPSVVYQLLLGRIIHRRTPTGEPVAIENNFHSLKKQAKLLCPQPKPPEKAPEKAPEQASKQSEYACFRKIIEALIARNLTIERTQDTKNVGPVLGEKSLDDPKAIKEIEAQGLQLVPVVLKDCITTPSKTCPEGLDGLSKDKKDALAQGVTLYRAQKPGGEYRFCFNEPFPPVGSETKFAVETKDDDQIDLPDLIRTRKIPEKAICSYRLAPVKPVPRAKADAKPEVDAKAQATAEAEPDKKPESERESDRSPLAPFTVNFGTDKDQPAYIIEVQPRSTEGVIYYLGEIARCNLNLDSGEQSRTVCKDGEPAAVVVYGGAPAAEEGEPADAGKPYGDTLFKVHSAKDADHAQDSAVLDERKIAVGFAGKDYWVQIDAAARDRSGQVLRVVTQLVALNRSAKDFPAPAVIPIISR